MFKNRFVVDQNTGSLIGSKRVSSLLVMVPYELRMSIPFNLYGITTFYGGLLPLNRPSYPILREGSDLGRDKKVNFGSNKIPLFYFSFYPVRRCYLVRYQFVIGPNRNSGPNSSSFQSKTLFLIFVRYITSS